MNALLLEYIGLSISESIVALLLSSTLFASGMLFLHNRRLKRDILRLQQQVEEISLDRESLLAFQRSMQEEDMLAVAQESDVTTGNNSLLQQELETYLLREAEESARSDKALLELSANFMDFLKVKSGKIELRLAPFTLDTLFNDLAISLRSQMARNSVELIFDIDSDVPPNLTGDKSHIRLLLFHIISNVMHVTTNPQVVLEVKCSKKGEDIVLYLALLGMDLEVAFSDIQQLFIPFSGGSIAESMQIEFYIAKELTKMMSGDITASVHSEKNVAFQIELHLKESHPDEKRYYHLPSRAMMGQKILIVNDNYSKNDIFK